MRVWPNDVANRPDQTSDLDELVLATRLLGADPALVLHGGGNSSVKTELMDVTGEPIEALLIKGSGQDMAAADHRGFSPLRLERLRRLLPPTRLLDDQLPNELRCALLDASGPDPSVETLSHTALPHKFILHSHADVILAVTNTARGAALIGEILGERVIVVDYCMPGVDLAAAIADAWATHGTDDVEGIVVLRHGLFTMGSSARSAYERHAGIVETVETYLHDNVEPSAPAAPVPSPDVLAIARLRKDVSAVLGSSALLHCTVGDVVERVTSEPTLMNALTRGPLTPDHATRTKPFPMVGRDVQAYASSYEDYVETNRRRRDRHLVELDSAPRVILDPELGLLTVGTTPAENIVNTDIALHTLATVPLSDQLGGYLPASPDHVFDLEYWGIQQAKMTRGRVRRPLDGQVGLVTGAASGIGRACAAALLEAGAAVVGLDISGSVATTFDGPAWLGLQVDVTDENAVAHALEKTVQSFGGLDILVPAAGIFPDSKPLGEMEMSAWRRTMEINVDSVAMLYGLTVPLLELSHNGGRVVVIASKNVLAPGTGAAAYSCSKAALTQLSRVAALEWAPKGIRVNMVHPDAVFDTGLWTPELLEARATHYGLSVDDYKRRNLLRTEVTARSVGALVLAMSTEPFRCTTGAQVPIDGGSDRVI